MAEDVHAHIEELVAEEHRLWELESSGGSGEEERPGSPRSRSSSTGTGTCSAAAARRLLGANQDDVPLRSEETVENYLQ